jgi:hypothetical protein
VLLFGEEAREASVYSTSLSPYIYGAMFSCQPCFKPENIGAIGDSVIPQTEQVSPCPFQVDIVGSYDRLSGSKACGG